MSYKVIFKSIFREVVSPKLIIDIFLLCREELPGHQPRFVIYSFKLDHGDGRISYPMCLLFSTPRDCKTELMVMYAGTKLSLVKAAELTKVYEIRDLDELTDDWLQDKMK